VELIVDRGGRVEGTIRRTGDGEPVTGGYVNFKPEGHPVSRDHSRVSAWVERDGRFATTLPAGTYLISWSEQHWRSHVNYYEPGVRVVVEEGKTASVTVTITPDTPFKTIPVRP
jgi:hypothetical protein